MTKKIMVALVLFVVLGPVAAGTPVEILIQEGATRLNGDQARAHLSGRTEKWTKGGAYYGSDGKMKAKWKGRFNRGTWEVHEDGRVCYKLAKWPLLCQYYMNVDGAITMIYEGQSAGAKEMVDGDKMSDL